MDRRLISARRGRVDKYGNPIAESFVPSITTQPFVHSALVDNQGRPVPGKIDRYGRPIEIPIQHNLGSPVPSAFDAAEVDIKELLKTQTGLPQNSAFTPEPQPSGSSDPVESTKPTSGSAYGFEDWGFFLDSTNRDNTSNYGLGQIQWTLTESNGGRPIANVVEVEISKIQFPRLVTQGSNPAIDPDIFYFNRVYVEIMNSPNRSGYVVSNNKYRFHFECVIDQINAQSISLIPMFDKYYFRVPIDSMSALQFRFWIPSMKPNSSGIMKPLSLLNDNIVVKLIPGTNPARFTIISAGDTTSVFGNVGALTPGVAVFMDGANTGIGAVDVAINSNLGMYVTTIIDAKTFEVGTVDASLTAVSGQNINIFVPKNRIAVSVRLTTVVRNITNYIDVSRS